MDNKALILSNSTLLSFTQWLSRLELSGRDSRVRTRFIRICKDRIEEVENARVELAKKYAKKDEEGKPVRIVDGQNNRFDFEPDQLGLFIQEYEAILQEQFAIDLLESNRETIEKIKELTLQTEQVFSGNDAIWYDTVCEQLEALG